VNIYEAESSSQPMKPVLKWVVEEEGDEEWGAVRCN